MRRRRLSLLLAAVLPIAVLVAVTHDAAEPAGAADSIGALTVGESYRISLRPETRGLFVRTTSQVIYEGTVESVAQEAVTLRTSRIEARSASGLPLASLMPTFLSRRYGNVGVGARDGGETISVALDRIESVGPPSPPEAAPVPFAPPSAK